MSHYFSKIIFITINVLFIVICAACTERQIVFGEVKGKIIDAETKKPIKGAVVFLHWQSEGSTMVRLYPGDPMYVTETTTDDKGNFVFLKSETLNFESKIKILDYGPFVGVSNPGYGFKLESLYNEKNQEGFSKSYYSTKTETYIVELRKASPEDIITNKINSDTSVMLRNIEYMLINQKCFIQHIPLTLNNIEAVLNTQVNNSGENIYRSSSSSIKNLLHRANLERNRCDAIVR